MPCLIRVKVVVVSVLGLMLSEKVAVELVESATPVAPAVGVLAVIVGGVVSVTLPQSTRASAQSPWSKLIPSPPSVTTRRSVCALATLTSIVFVARRPGHQRAVVHLGRVREHLEDDRAVGADLVVDADRGLEAAAGAAEEVLHVGGGVHAQALGVGRAVERDREPVTAREAAVALVLLDRPVAARRRGCGEVAHIARAGWGRGGSAAADGGREGPARVGGERVAGQVLDSRGTALDGRRVARARLERGARGECRRARRIVVGHARRQRGRGSLLGQGEGARRQRARVDGTPRRSRSGWSRVRLRSYPA